MAQPCPHSAAELADQYLTGTPAEPTEFELALFRSWIAQEYAPLVGSVDYILGDVPPERMLFYYLCHQRLLISVAHNVHPYLTPTENAWFRAVHDHHHLVSNSGFDLDGEFNTYLHATKTAPAEIHWVLYSEIVLQAATAIHTGEFAEQKLVRV